MKLEDKTSIITGGGSGIGEAISKRMAQEGAYVVIADMAIKQANEVVDKIKTLGGKAIATEVDVTKSQDVSQMIKTFLGRFGKIEEDWDYVISLNLKGVRNCTKAVINHMIQNRSGKIINIASVAGVKGTANIVDYSAAKAGVIGFTRALAKEVASYGINVNSVSPGPIATPLFLRNSEDFKERIRKDVLIGRLGQPEEIANMVVFLASEEADFIIGQNFIVDGGRSL
jgi:NAD(P)-dependent dehydrogenase (short-subunit alcohol dehydrogenase family)